MEDPKWSGQKWQSPTWKSPEIEDPKIDNPKMKEARKPRGLLTACPFFFIGITWGIVIDVKLPA